jgi:hypothetical protein
LAKMPGIAFRNCIGLLKLRFHESEEHNGLVEPTGMNLRG